MIINNQEMPGEWYDLVGRVSILQTVASCALEAVPCDDDHRGKYVADLVAAMEDILRLMQADVHQIETTLKL